jgi:glycosyltransferase involved in cell wall biosynthesis
VLSIVTVTYNDAVNLQDTLKSIRTIKSAEIEFMVIDGGSSDNTFEIIEAEKDIIDVYVSERDKGTFDAMNKAIDMASGKWLLFINSGDTIFSKAEFQKLNLSNYSEFALVYGNTFYEGVGARKPFPVESLSYGLIMACHQGMLYNRDLLKDELYYTNEYKLISDYELTCRILKKGYKIKYLDIVIARFLGGGISSNKSWEARKARYTYVFRFFGLRGFIYTIAESLGIISLPSRVD